MPVTHFVGVYANWSEHSECAMFCRTLFLFFHVFTFLPEGLYLVFWILPSKLRKAVIIQNRYKLENHPKLSRPSPPPKLWIFQKVGFFLPFLEVIEWGYFLKCIYLIKLLFIPILNSLYICSLDLWRCHIASNKTFNTSIMTMYYYLSYLESEPHYNYIIWNPSIQCLK